MDLWDKFGMSEGIAELWQELGISAGTAIVVLAAGTMSRKSTS